MIDKDEHKRGQNEQFERACKEIQKRYIEEFNKEFKKLVFEILIYVGIIAFIVFLLFAKCKG